MAQLSEFVARVLRVLGVLALLGLLYVTGAHLVRVGLHWVGVLHGHVAAHCHHGHLAVTLLLFAVASLVLAKMLRRRVVS